MCRILRGESFQANTVRAPVTVQEMRDRIEALKAEKERLEKVPCHTFVVVCCRFSLT